MRTLSFIVLIPAVCGVLLLGARTARAQEGTTAPPAASSAPSAQGGGFSLDRLTKLSAATLGQAEDDDGAEESPWLLSGWSLSGYLETSYTFNFNDPESQSNGPVRIFDTRHNSFDLNHVQLHVQKSPTDGSWVGLQVRAFAGQDAQVTHSTGLFDDKDGVGASGSDSDLDVISANIQIMVPKNDDINIPVISGSMLQVGKFETIIGAEVISSPENHNFSRSILFGKAIPFTHTGVLWTSANLLDLGDDVLDDNPMSLVFKLGVVNGWDNVEDTNQVKDPLMGVSFAPCEWFDISVNGIVGSQKAGDKGDNKGVIDFVANIKSPSEVPEGMEFCQGFSCVLNFDYGSEENVGLVPSITGNPNGVYSEWYGFAGILRYDFDAIAEETDPLSDFHVAFRGEAFWDEQGQAVGARSSTTTTRFAKRFMELTFTLGYEPFDNLLLRAEYRYDKANASVFDDQGRTLDENHQNTFALDAIVTF